MFVKLIYFVLNFGESCGDVFFYNRILKRFYLNIVVKINKVESFDIIWMFFRVLFVWLLIWCFRNFV